MTEHSGTMVRWIIDGKNAGIGYFQKWSLPIPGDHVYLEAERAGDPRRHVEILLRTFEQPEANLPLIWIHARTIAA